MGHVPELLFDQGALAFQQARYAEAIEHLEQFCQSADNRRSKSFFQAQMWLVQAYYKNRQDLHAMALCEQLAQSNIPTVQRWAAHALEQITATPSLEGTTLTPPGQALANAPEPKSREVPPFPRARSGQWVQGQSRYASRSRSPRPVRGSQDLSNQILSALCHGSISMLASLLLFVLFQDSALATGLGLLRFGVPVAILYLTQDEVVKVNAREATNYAITSLLLLVAIAVAAIFLVIIFMVAPPIAILLGLPLGAYLLALSIYPLVGTVLCARDNSRMFCYPNWLILHLV